MPRGKQCHLNPNGGKFFYLLSSSTYQRWIVDMILHIEVFQGEEISAILTLFCEPYRHNARL